MAFLIGFGLGNLVGVFTARVLAAAKRGNYYIQDPDSGREIRLTHNEARDLSAAVIRHRSKSCQH